MKILIVTHLCSPEPDLKGLPFAKKLTQLGHSVEILTGLPNYPGGKLYKGYRRKVISKERVDGVTIIRFLSYYNHSNSNVKRILAYFSFAIVGAVWGLFKTSKADVIYVNMTPAPIAFPALVIKLFRRTPVVLDIQDLWPETLETLQTFNSKTALSIIDIICKKFYKWSDFVVIPSHGLYDLLLSKGVPSSKLQVIYNWSTDIKTPDQDVQLIRKQYGLNGFSILYAGNVGAAQGLEVILQAAEILQQEKQIQFVILGNGVELERLKLIKAEKNLDNVLFIDQVPVSFVSNILNSAQVLLVHLLANNLSDKMIPSKTQAYLLQGKPVLMGVDGEACALIENIQAGLCFKSGDGKDLAMKAKSFSLFHPITLDTLGGNGKQFYEQYLSIDVGVSSFLEVFNTIIGKNN